jgi:hypothetical protein
MAEIPTFQTLAEAAAFWDTHDFEDYVDNTESVSFQVKIPRRTAKNIIRLTGKLSGNRLILSSGDQTVRVHDNQITLEDGRRIIVDMIGAATPA